MVAPWGCKCLSLAFAWEQRKKETWWEATEKATPSHCISGGCRTPLTMEDGEWLSLSIPAGVESNPAAPDCHLAMASGWRSQPVHQQPPAPWQRLSQAAGAHRALGAAGKGTRILPSALRPLRLSIAMTSARAGAGPGRASSLLGRATASAPTRHRTAAKPRLLSRTFANPTGFDVRGCPREAHKGRFQGCSAKRWRTSARKGRRRCWVSPR